MTSPHRPCCHQRWLAPAEVNAAIRRLMDGPSYEGRAEEYANLLALWAEATGPRDRWNEAA